MTFPQVSMELERAEHDWAVAVLIISVYLNHVECLILIIAASAFLYSCLKLHNVNFFANSIFYKIYCVTRKWTFIYSNKW